MVEMVPTQAAVGSGNNIREGATGTLTNQHLDRAVIGGAGEGVHLVDSLRTKPAAPA